jgi:hypothetical protein
VEGAASATEDDAFDVFEASCAPDVQQVATSALSNLVPDFVV